MSDAVSDSERVTGRAGVQQARRALAVEIERDGAIYKPQCCGRPYASWHDASAHITSNECVAEKLTATLTKKLIEQEGGQA